MKKIFVIFFGLPILVSIFTTSAMALGIGVYGTAGGGNSNFSNSHSDSSSNSSKSMYGGGLIVDTAVAKDTLLNYRLNFGYDKNSYENDSLNRISLINSLGFGIVKNENIRFWVGPQLALRYIYYNQSYYNILFILAKYEGKINMFGADAGLVLGININLGSVATIALEGGLRYGFAVGPSEVKATTIGGFSFKRSTTTTMHGFEGYGSIAFMYRISDTYGSK